MWKRKTKLQTQRSKSKYKDERRANFRQSGQSSIDNFLYISYLYLFFFEKQKRATRAAVTLTDCHTGVSAKRKSRLASRLISISRGAASPSRIRSRVPHFAIPHPRSEVPREVRGAGARPTATRRDPDRTRTPSNLVGPGPPPRPPRRGLNQWVRPEGLSQRWLSPGQPGRASAS